jgi:hypothetical protein
MEVVERKSASHGEAGYPRAAFDFYPTEPWVTRALLQAVDLVHLGDIGDPKRTATVWEPACGDGRMARVLIEAGYHVFASDIADHGYGRIGVDFLQCLTLPAPEPPCGAIVTNPPFGLAKRFIAKALDMTLPWGGKVAMVQRHEFDAPFGNRPLFEPPFAAKLVLHKRPRWSDDDKASPRFPYAWYLWDWRHQGPPVLHWLADPDATPKAVGRLL